MMTRVNIHIAQTYLSELVQKILLKSKIIIARNPKRRVGLAKEIVAISPVFDEPLDDFQDYQK